MKAVHDLTGRWHGVYFYPVDPELNPFDDVPPMGFVAELVDHGGHITGQTWEGTSLLDPHGPDVEADIEGHRIGTDLSFTKSPQGHWHTIEYHGQISEDGLSVSGTWAIPGSWSGTWRMNRKTVLEPVKEEVEAEAST